MTFTAKQFHRAYRRYVVVTQGRIKSFREWCKTFTLRTNDQIFVGADWLRNKGKKP